MLHLQQEIDLRGILTPDQWDDQGRAVRLRLSAPEEREYLILPDSVGCELCGALGRQVAVKALLVHGDLGLPTIRVIQYIINPEKGGNRDIS